MQAKAPHCASHGSGAAGGARATDLLRNVCGNTPSIYIYALSGSRLPIIISIFITGVVSFCYFFRHLLSASSCATPTAALADLQNISIKSDTKTTLCVVSVFKNEGHAINEWLQHYRNEGVDAFFLVDNGSTDHFKISDLSDVTLKHDESIHAQVALYNSFYENVRGFDFVAVVDLDEFMFAKRGTLKEYVSSMPCKVSQVLVSWSMFGSSGFDKQPESIIKSFTWRQRGVGHHFNTKYIVRGSAIKWLMIHTADLRFFTGDTIRDDENLQINHYAIQSREFFSSVKMRRGDAASANYEKTRTWDYFQSYDFHDYEDTSLRNKR